MWIRIVAIIHHKTTIKMFVLFHTFPSIRPKASVSFADNLRCQENLPLTISLFPNCIQPSRPGSPCPAIHLLNQIQKAIRHILLHLLSSDFYSFSLVPASSITSSMPTQRMLLTIQRVSQFPQPRSSKNLQYQPLSYPDNPVILSKNNIPHPPQTT